MAFTINSKKIATNTIALYVRLGLTMIISFFTARVTLQQLGVDDYGLNNLVGSIVSMFSFINGSMGTAVQRFYSIEIGKQNEERLGRVFGVGLYLHVIVAAITVVLAEIFAVFFLHKMNIPEERMMAAQVVFQISVFSLALNIINVPYASLLRAREMFSQTAIVEIIQALLRLVVLFLLVRIDYDKLITYSLLNLCISLIYVTAMFFMARRFKETHNWPCRDKKLIKQMVSFISMLLLTVLAQLLKTKGLVVLINLFFSLAVNAAYAVAVQVSNMVNSFVINFKQAMVPQMMSAYGAGDKENMQRLINTGTKITFILLLMMSLPIIFEGQWILNLWLGNPPEHSSRLVALVLININISSYTYFLYQGVHATGNITKQQMWMSGSYLVNVVFVYLVFKMGFGFTSALYVNMAVSAFQCGVNLYYAHQCYGYDCKLFFKHLLLPCLIIVLLCSSAGLLSVCLFSECTLRSVLLIIGLLILVPACGYFILLDDRERKMCLELFGRLFKKKRTNEN